MNTSRPIVFAALIAAGLPAGNLLAQQSNASPDQAATTIASGTVRTADGSPIPGASLRLVNTDTRKAFVSWTDESGKFQFAALPAGHYTVEASQLGFLPARLDVEFGGGPPPRQVRRRQRLTGHRAEGPLPRARAPEPRDFCLSQIAE